METLNGCVNAMTDCVLWPWFGESVWPGLLLASLLTAGLLVGLFRLTSNQAELRRARNRFLARAMELLLFQHDLRVSLSACGRILSANAWYLSQLLIPISVATPPLVLIFVQLGTWFDFRPLRVGESVVVAIELDAAHPVIGSPVEIVLPPFAHLDSPAVRIPARNELAWRVVATESGVGWIELSVRGVRERKSLAVGTDVIRTSTRRVRTGFLRQLLYPAEPPLSQSGPVRGIEVCYPARQISLGTTTVPWPVAAVLLMMLFGLVLGRLAGVRIA